MVNGACRIAKVRRALNLSFKDAWEVITGVNFNHPTEDLSINNTNLRQYRNWMQLGEPTADAAEKFYESNH